MKTTFARELPLLLIVLLPAVYLMIVWSHLAAQIPTHYNLSGEVDRYGSKAELAAMAILLPSVIYLVMLLVPVFDPKGKIEKMGNKFYRLKFVLVLFISALTCYFIFAAGKGGNVSPNALVAMIALFMAALGNYFQSLRPNYFIGIRTPWTLENETVWRDTHRIGGRIWMAGGIAIAAASFFITAKYFFVVFIGVIVVMALIPVVYSFVKYRAIKKQPPQG